MITLATVMVSIGLIAIALFLVFIAYQRYQERKMKRQLNDVMSVFEKMGGVFNESERKD